MKVTYLVYLLKEFGPWPSDDDSGDVVDDEGRGPLEVPRAKSVILFASTCFMCQLIADTLIELGVCIYRKL